MEKTVEVGECCKKKLCKKINNDIRMGGLSFVRVHKGRNRGILRELEDM